jgi:hypothetical protein
MSANVFATLAALGIAGALVTLTSVSRADSQLDDFRHGLSLHAGTDLIYEVPPSFAGAANLTSAMHGVVDLGIGGRVGVAGVMIGGQVALEFWSPGEVWIVPGISVGYAIPIEQTWALLPQARVVFIEPFQGPISTQIQMTAELGCVFFAKAGFMEPFVMVGDWYDTGAQSSNMFFGVGYRIGLLL